MSVSLSPHQVENSGIGYDFDRSLWFKAMESFNLYAAAHIKETSTATERLSEEVEKILDGIESGEERVTRYDNVNDYLRHLDDKSEE